MLVAFLVSDTTSLKEARVSFGFLVAENTITAGEHGRAQGARGIYMLLPHLGYPGFREQEILFITPLAPLLLFIQGTTACGMLLSSSCHLHPDTHILAESSSLEHPQHTQKCVSQESLNPGTLTVEMNHTHSITIKSGHSKTSGPQGLPDTKHDSFQLLGSILS